MAGVWEAFFPFIFMETFSTLVMLLLQHMCSQRNCFYTFLSSLSTLTFQLLCFFSFLKCSYFCLLSFYHTFSFMTSQGNWSPFLSSSSPLTFYLFCLFSFLNIHLSSLSPAAAFIMQQVTSHILLVNQFFDLAGFSGFFVRSPERTSVLDRVVAHRLPRASTVRWDFHICAINTVLSTKVTESSVMKPSGKFELNTVREVGGFVRLLEDDIFSFFLKVFHCIPPVDIFFSQLQKQTINSVFVQGIMQQFTQFF